MEFSTEYRDGALIARVGGRIDGANADDFEMAMQTGIRNFEGPFIIDCEGLSYISSVGMRAILAIAKTLGERNAKFAICSLSEPIAELFRISGFGQIMSIHSSRSDAIAWITPLA